MTFNLSAIARSASRCWLALALGVIVAGHCSAVAAADAVRYDYFVFSNPAEGRETEFNRWYQQEHAPFVVANDGVVNAQLYAATHIDSRDAPPRENLAIYHILSTDLAATFAAFKRTPEPPQGQPLAPGSTVLFTYQLLGPRIGGAGPKSFGDGALKTYAFFVRNGPFLGKDAQYNAWYDEVHAPDVAATPGVVSAQRFILSDVQRNASVPLPPTKYLVRYDVVTDDLAQFFGSLDRRAKNFVISPAFDPKTSTHFTYQVLGPEIGKSSSNTDK